MASAWLAITRAVSRPDLISVVGPRTEAHRAELFVEREELDVHRARALVDRRRLPVNEAGGPDRRLRHQRHLVVAVGAGVHTDTRSKSLASDRFS